MYDMINKFIHGLRVNFSANSASKLNNCYEFDIHKVIVNFDKNYFDKNVSTEQFYLFWVDFINNLKDNNILILKEDLLNVMYFSFNLMILGNNKIYDVYDLTLDDVESNLNKILVGYNQRTLESKFYINDLLVSLVLSSSVPQVCAQKTINNIFIEALNIKK